MQNYEEMQMQAYPVLIGLIVRLIESQAGKKIIVGDEWRNEAQALGLKLLRHAVSMKQLSEVSTMSLEGEGVFQHIDHSSINVIARAMLETYLVWHYLYATKSPTLSKFRYLTWRLGGLLDRQKLTAISKGSLEVQAKEAAQAELIRAEITTFDAFQGLSTKKQRKLLEGDWKIVMGTADLAVAAGFHGTYFDNVYRHLCGYSHSSYLSALQVAQAGTLAEQSYMTRRILGVAVVTMAHFACAYPKQFPEASAVLEADPAGKTTAETWALMAETMARVYPPASTAP
jgi:hypothetical protein